MATDVRLKDIDVRGKSVTVWVTADGGFKAEAEPDVWVHSSTLEDLVKKVQDATRETSKLNIEFWRWDDGELKRGVIFGLHAGSRNIRVKLGDKRAEQEYPWESGDGKYLKLDEYQRETYTQLCRDVDRAEAAKKDYERSNSFNAVKAVQVALGKAGV